MKFLNLQSPGHKLPGHEWDVFTSFLFIPTGKVKLIIFICCLQMLAVQLSAAPPSSPYTWQVTAIPSGPSSFEIRMQASTTHSYWLYSPGQTLLDFKTSDLSLADSSIRLLPLSDSGNKKEIKNPLFDNLITRVVEGPAVWKTTITFPGNIPAYLSGTLSFCYGNADEFYPSEPFHFQVALAGGKDNSFKLKIPSIQSQSPVSTCGDDQAADKSLLAIFLLGLTGGLIALLTPCVFPMIPLTVSFFTKGAASRKKGMANAFLYGACIFLLYIVLSLPFHFLDHLNPEILNSISTNAILNLVFFIIFVIFAFSFFGFYEISLPSSIVNRINPRAGTSTFWGILFMALTLALVSFSCTGPILGSLLAGAISSNGGAIQLSFGMAGFGLGLALPFALFSIFPRWLQSLPKSGGWLHSVKVVLGFIELGMALKFLSNADLVKQWGILKREVFIGLWIIICIGCILYLLGFIRFPHDSKKVTFPPFKRAFTITLLLFTGYLFPGVLNSPLARLSLISGFPPPACYSVYKNSVNCGDALHPLKDYEQALKLASKENKPILIDFTGWACVNCRRMEENVWTNPEVYQLMKDSFVLVSLYVDERTSLPPSEQHLFTTSAGNEKFIRTVGDKWATFQSENFNAVSQPQYATLNPDQQLLTRNKGYTPDPVQFKQWLLCALKAFRSRHSTSL